MAVIEIRPVWPTQRPDELDSIVALVHAVDAELDPDDPPAAAERVLLDLTAAVPIAGQRALIAWEDGVAAGFARNWYWYGRRNRHLGESTIVAHPDHRRRGIGTALARATARAFLADGRTTLLTFGVESTATEAFWRHHGVEIGYRERESRLDVPAVDEALMAEWIARRHERAADYHLVHWRGPVPDELLSEFRLVRNAMNDAPLGTLDFDKGLDDESEIEQFGAWVVASGRESWVTAAVDGSGAIGGFTAVWIDLVDPVRSWQADTGVLNEHRGRGLGRWLKAAMWQRLRVDAPDVTRLVTENATDNDAMLAINVAMGFAPHRVSCGWQPDIEALAAD